MPTWGSKPYRATEFVDLWLGPTHLGVRPVATQHLLGAPYFKSVTENEIVVEWQQLASHGRKVKGEEETWSSPMARIEETSDGRSWMCMTFVKTEAGWRVAVIRPEVIYHTGDFRKIGRPEAGPDMRG